ncbi:MAG TPA: hypothetical protein ENJ82_18150, partial [Bacteroidetes bacterium]|nr:hypothetical protein [Bacteroidota bacterium]
QWAAASLDNLQFETKVEAVHFRENCFEVHHNSGVSYAKNLSIGTGLSPNIPDFAQPFLGKQVFHAINYLLKIPQMSGKKVTVIGGGQSGAEVIRRLIADHDALPQQINWVTRRGNFFPIDDSPFVNEFFFPPYSEYFFNLPGPQKKEINKVNLLASDGISMDLLEMIYRELYEIECLEGRGKICRFFPEHAVFAMKSQGEQLHLSCQDSGLSKVGNLQSDVVILATGFAYKIPGFFSPLLDHLDQKEGKFSLNRDFSIPWNGPQGHKVFLLNGCRHTRGVADPNLSLLSYRSAMVVNSLLGRQVYDLEGESAALEWPAPVPAQSFSSSNGASLSAQDFHFKTN